MSVERINSLIKTYFSDKLMRDLERVFYAKSFIDYPKEVFEKFNGKFRSKDMGDKVRLLILHNNDRISIYKALINLHWNRPVNFGTGTNRMAVIVDSYVFKIAMDHAGCVDNLHEFIMSSEMQPYVTKCYETNELISVSEYVNVISDKAQFENRKDEIMGILRELESSTSLMLDVGFIPKNMTNWGVRPSDGRAVILDYGYLYTDLEGIQLTCADNKCIKKFGITKLVYTDDYSHMICPNCGKEVSVIELQSLITTEARTRMYDSKMEKAFKVTKPVTYFNVDEFGDYVEMEEADDSMIVTKKKRKENLEEVMEKYKEICAEYQGQVITMGEPSDNIQQQRETLRRMILEIKYDMDYGDMDLETQLEDPYELEELDMKRMRQLTNNPLDRIVDSVVDDGADEYTKERVRREIEDEDSDEIQSTLMTYRERDKIFSKLLARRGDKPIIEDYEDDYDRYYAPPEETYEYEDEEEFIPITKKKEKPKEEKNFTKNFGGIEIELGFEDDEDLLDETSKFIDSLTIGDKSSDALDETSFKEAKIVSEEIEKVDSKTEITNVVLDKPGVNVEVTSTNNVESLEIESDEILMELDDCMVDLLDSDSEEVISDEAEISEEVEEMDNRLRRAFNSIQDIFDDEELNKDAESEISNDRSNKTEEPKKIYPYDFEIKEPEEPVRIPRIMETERYIPKESDYEKLEVLDVLTEEVISDNAEISEEDNLESLKAQGGLNEEVISERAEISEEVTFVANIYESEEVVKMTEKFKETFQGVQQTFDITESGGVTESEISDSVSNKTEEPEHNIETVMEIKKKVEEAISSLHYDFPNENDELNTESIEECEPEEETQLSFEDDDFDLDNISQALFNEDDEIESFGNSSFITNVVRSEDEDLVDEEVIVTKHVEETVRKVDPQEDSEFDFDDEDEFDEIYEQNYREKSMKSSKKNFK